MTATDRDGATVSDSFTLDVLATNHAPILATPLPDQTAAADEMLVYAFAMDALVDQDTGDTLSYTASLASGSALPPWLNFDSVTHSFQRFAFVR